MIDWTILQQQLGRDPDSSHCASHCALTYNGRRIDMTLYYVQDNRDFVGNSMLWWRPGGAGYTTDISQAGQYEHKPSDRDTDVLWNVDYINSIANLHVDHQRTDPDAAIPKRTSAPRRQTL